MTKLSPQTLRISETFSSRQGEGKLTGTESFFIRTSGCNLRCWFCDTPYASWDPKGSHESIEQVLQIVHRSGLKHVVLTGGEPLLPPAIVELAGALRAERYHITIETAGTVERDVACDLMSISPKFASSTPAKEQHPSWHELHNARRMPLDIMRTLIDQADDYQLKFVVDSERDFAELESIVSSLSVPHENVFVMPQGSTIEAMDSAIPWLQPWTESSGYNYCDRMQIRWFGNRRGT